MAYTASKEGAVPGRVYWLAVVVGLFMLWLLYNAWYLQIVKGDDYLELSDNNRLRAVGIPPLRGLIYDRNGTLLVHNTLSLSLYVVLEDMPKRIAVLDRLAQLIGMDRNEMERRITHKKRVPYQNIKVKSGLSMGEIARVEGHRLELPGVKIEPEFKRTTVYGSMAAHLLGYVGEISSDDLKLEKYAGAKQGDMIGKYGIEQMYDRLIQGSSGRKEIEVDALGQELRQLKVVQPVRGKDLYLTLHWPLQQAAEKALGDRAGAIIAMNPRSGEVLAMVSHPAFDPTLLSSGAAAWDDLVQDKRRPLINRAIQGQYPPGSVFKIVMSTALLEDGTASPLDTVDCPGSFPFGNRVFRDWKEEGHGMVALHRALVESCDVYFYKMGRRLKIDTISEYAHRFGLGEPTGIDLGAEKIGLIPSRQWKRSVLKQPWYPGETLSVAIGQGYVSVTPLQMVRMISAVANNGVRYPARLLHRVYDPQTKTTDKLTPPPGQSLNLSPHTLRTIRDALTGVVSEPSGTAFRSQSQMVSMAGKTGTAQVIAMRAGESRDTPPKINDHAWFVAYAPSEAPTIAVAVLVEHGGHGGSAAAPLARSVVEQYFRGGGPTPLKRGVPST